MAITLTAAGFSTLDPLAIATPQPGFANPLAGSDGYTWSAEQAARNDLKRKQESERLEKIDAAILDPAAFFKKNPYNPTFADDPEKARRRALVSLYLRHENDGQPLPMGADGHELMRRRVSATRFSGRGAEDDDAFLAEVTKSAQGRKDRKAISTKLMDDAAARAVIATTEPQNPAGQWGPLRETLRTMPGWDATSEPDFHEAYLAIQREARAALADYAEPLKKVWSAFKSKGDTAAEALAAYETLDAEDRPRFMTSLALLAKSLPEKERPAFWSNLRKQSGRDLSNLATDTATGIISEGQRGGAVGWEDFFGSPEALAKRQAAERGIEKNFRLRADFLADVRNIEQNTYDPVKTLAPDGSWTAALERGAYAAPGAIASTAAAAIPGIGMPAFYASSREMAYQQFRQSFQAEGLPYEQAASYADTLAPVAAIPQVLAERLQIKAISGKLPILEKAIQSLEGRIKSKAMAFAARAAVGTAEEAALEQAQNLIPAAVQDIAHALETDIPDVNWSDGRNGVLDGFWKDSAGMVVTMLPLAIVGAGVGVFKSSARFAAASQASDQQLLALGASPEAVSNFRMAEGIGALEQALDAMASTLDPQGETAKAATERMKEEIRMTEQARQDLEKIGYATPRLVQTAEGISVVDSVSGEEIGTAPDLSGALRIAKGHTVALDDLQADQVAALGTLMEAARAATEIDPASAVDVAFDETFDPEKASPDQARRYAAQVALLEQSEGGSGDIARSVLGTSETTFAQGMRTTINRIYRGGSVLTVFHETFHGLRRAAHARGAITRADEISLLRGLDSVLAGKRVKGGRELRFIPEGVTDDQISDTLLDEAVSEIAEMEVLRTRKGASKGKLGVTRGIVSRNLTALAKLMPGVAGKFQAFLRAVRAHWGLSLSRAVALKAAERRGEFDTANYQEFLDRLLGLDAQREHDDGVRAELNRILAMPEVDAEDEIPFSIGRNVQLPTPTKKSRPIAGPAPIGADSTADSGLNPVSIADSLAFQSAPAETGDTGQVAFSITRARENYERAANKVLYAKKELQEAEEISSNAREKWEKEHGKKVDLQGRQIIGIRSTYPYVSMRGRSQYGGVFNDNLSQFLDSNNAKNRTDGALLVVGSRPFQTDGVELASLVTDSGTVVYELPQYDHAPFPEPSELIAAREALAQAEADLYLAGQEFDPETDARIADAEKIRQRELDKKAAMFAALLDARDEDAKNASRSFVAKVWKAYGEFDELFQFGRSPSQKADDIAAAVSVPGKMVTSAENGESVRFMGKEGHITIQDADSDRPYISASSAGSQGKKSGGGSQLYAAALDWIHNNGKRIKDDPAGITGINMVRRTSNFFASAIRWGTTKHLAPHASQHVGKWTKNHLLNTSLLATKEMENVFKVIPETRGWTFDFSSGRFLRDGSLLTQADLERSVQSADPAKSGIGLSTLQRAVITASAIQEFQRGTTADALVASELPGGLTGVSYSLGPADVPAIMEQSALSRVRDPRRRTHAMTRIARDFNSIRLQIDRLLALSGRKRSKAELRQEANAREDLRAEELIADVHRRFGSVLADEDLVKIKSQPVHAFLADPKSPLRGRVMSKAAAIKAFPDRYALHRGGEYDGSEAVSRSVFGGTRMPDQAAQELFDHGLISEPTPDAMWEALLAEQNSVAKMKEALAKATEQIREAKAEAKREATEWLQTQGKDQETNFNPREEILRSLRMLDAILLAMPPEVRGKIGGYTQMARITTDEAKLSFLKDKLAKADKELEIFLREEFGKEFEDLMKRARPTKDAPGERPSGSIDPEAWEIFKMADAATHWKFREAEAEATKWESLADHEDTTPEEAQKYSAMAQVIRLCQNWEGADAARREMAVMELDSIYYGGLLKLRQTLSARNERLGRLRDSARAGTGKIGDRMEIKDAKKKSWKLAWEIMSFGQVVNVLFGEDSAAARWYNARELAASNALEDAMQVKANALESLLETLAGSRFAGEKLRNRMQTEESIKVTDALGNPHTFTEAEATTFLLMWRQDDGARHMRGITDDSGAIVSTWGWNEAAAAEVERQLSPAGKQVLAFLGASYGEEYDRINDVFRRIWHVAMPRHKMYAPLTVKATQAKADTIMDPVSGDTMGIGMTPGSLKNRSQSAVAEPDFRDAFQVYLTHARQMEHFIAYGEFARDALAVINRRDTRNAIEAAGGEVALNTLGRWVDYFAMGGIRDANMGSAWMQALGRSLGRLSQAALVGRVSVLAMQSLQLAAAAYKMPLGAFLTRFVKLQTGMLGWGDAIRSPYIQRRLAEMPPVVRDAIRGLEAGSPNRLKFLAAKAGRTIAGADALFTAGTYAIFYDYHLKQNGGDEAAAHAEAERLTDQVAQPTRAGARSMIELANSGNPAFRALWNFSSDPRQKLSLIVYELMRRDKSGLDKGLAAGKAIAITWAVSGILQAVLRAVMRDIRSDDDDEVFDERHWNLKRLALQALYGPLGAAPIWGDVAESAGYKLTGQYLPQGSILSAPADAFGLIPKWMKGDIDPTEDAEKLFTGGAAFSGTSAAAASASHLLRDAVNITENFIPD